MEGNRVIGILNLESTKMLWCGELQRRLVRYAARLASYIFVNYKMCLESAQAKLLHGFGLATEHMLRPDIAAYLNRVLATADTLTISPDTERWAQVALVHDGVIDFGPCLLTPANRYIPGRESSGHAVIYQPLLQMLEDRKSRFIPNIEAPEEPQDDENLPWEKAKSLICVPLVVPDGDDPDAEDAAIGYLTVASSLPYYLNDSDHAILRSFAETVTHGLMDLAHLYSRASLMREVRERFGAFRLPDEEEMRDVYKAILRMGKIEDVHRRTQMADDTAERFREMEDPLRLVGQLPHWYLLLANYHPQTMLERDATSSGSETPSHPIDGPESASPAGKHDTSDSVSLGDIESVLTKPMNTYVKLQVGGSVYWRWEPPENAYELKHLRIRVGRDDDSKQVLIAAVFGCIATASAACRKGDANRHDIRVEIAKTSEGKVTFTIRYTGKAISEHALSVIPRYRLDEDTKLGSFEQSERRLVEVQRIAKALGGSLAILASDSVSDSVNEHAIVLEIPYLATL